MEWAVSLNEVKIQKIQVCHVKIKKKEKYILKKVSSGTSKSNIPIVSFPKTHSIQASLDLPATLKVKR